MEAVPQLGVSLGMKNRASTLSAAPSLPPSLPPSLSSLLPPSISLHLPSFSRHSLTSPSTDVSVSGALVAAR
eukprot:3932836-Rhodomonas_salina.1